MVPFKNVTENGCPWYFLTSYIVSSFTRCHIRDLNSDILGMSKTQDLMKPD